MKHQLTTVLALLLRATSISSTPVAELQSHCTNHPIFTLHNITYSDDTIYSTSAHMAVAGGSIQFNLTNTAVSYTTTCSAYVGDDGWPEFFYGNQIFYCKTPLSAGSGTSTNFTYSSSGAKLVVNSTRSRGEGDEKQDIFRGACLIFGVVLML
jgi:hypothetical protein